MKKSKIKTSGSYMVCEDVVAREIQGEFILVPITSGIGDLEGAIYSLNETGKSVWQKLDGKKTLRDIIDELTEEFEGEKTQIESDVLGLVSELHKRRMIFEVD